MVFFSALARAKHHGKRRGARLHGERIGKRLSPGIQVGIRKRSRARGDDHGASSTATLARARYACRGDGIHWRGGSTPSLRGASERVRLGGMAPRGRGLALEQYAQSQDI